MEVLYILKYMTIPDLLFLGLVAASAATLLTALVLALGGNRSRAGAIVKTWGIGFAAYMAVVVVASILLPRRVAQMGEALCSDDWCLAVVGAGRVAEGYRIGFRIESRARRVTQRERGVSVYLTDAGGRRFEPRRSAGEPPFDVTIGPGERIETRRVFDVPEGVRPVGIVIRRESGFPIGWFIIGYPTWFGKPEMVRLAE
jgi:hypothetical protein